MSARVKPACCEKCGCSNFSIQKRDGGGCIYIKCDICGNVVGALEDIDFKFWHERITKNNDFFEKRINDIENQLKDIRNQNKCLIDAVERLSSNIT